MRGTLEQPPEPDADGDAQRHCAGECDRETTHSWRRTGSWVRTECQECGHEDEEDLSESRWDSDPRV